MISIDERVGSRELLQLIRNLGVEADLGGKLAADFEFCGNGPDGAVLVGFERKALPDLLQSMREKRLAGSQAGPMIATYDVRYIIVEGVWRKGDNGFIESLHGRDWRPVRGNFRYSEVMRFLASMREFGDFRIWRTNSDKETASYIVEEYHWWQKDWSAHTTHNTLYSPDATRKRRSGHRASMFRSEVTLLEAWLGRLPRIDSRAEELAAYFSSAADMATATVERWCSIKGIGKKTAEDIVGEINKV